MLNTNLIVTYNKRYNENKMEWLKFFLCMSLASETSGHLPTRAPRLRGRIYSSVAKFFLPNLPSPNLPRPILSITIIYSSDLAKRRKKTRINLSVYIGWIFGFRTMVYSVMLIVIETHARGNHLPWPVIIHPLSDYPRDPTQSNSNLQN